MNEHYKTLLCHVQEGVVTIQLNRADHRNAFNHEMRDELTRALDLANKNSDVRSIVLTGSGGSFSTGQDLSERISAGPEIFSLVKDEYGPIIQLIDQSDKIVIAAVDGPSAGVGAAIALACDFVVMNEDSYFLLAFINIALLPDGGATWQLVQQVGYKRALEIATSGKPLSAREAVELGLANKTVTSESALVSAQAWAKRIAQKAPLAMSYTKRALKQSQASNLTGAITFEAGLQSILMNSDDAKEGIVAFSEKRSPVFTGS